MQTRGLIPFVVASALASAWACRDADPIPAICPPPRNDNTPCTPGDFCRDPASTCANGGALVFGTEFLCDAKTKLWRRFSVSYDCGDAGANGKALQQNRAGTALTFAAAVFGAGQIQIVTQNAQQCAVRLGVDAATGSVHIQFGDPGHTTIVIQISAAHESFVTLT